MRTSPPPPPHPPTPRPLPAWSLCVALAALAAQPTAARAADPVVMVLDFANHTGDSAFDVLGKGIADMVLTDLAAVPGLTVVERARLRALVDELAMQRSGLFDPATAQQTGKLVGASHAVSGAITAAAPELRIDIRLIAVTSGEVLVADKVVGPDDRVFALQQALVERFVAGMERELPGGLPATQVARLDTLVAYARALDQVDRGDLDGASTTLGEVVTAEPDFRLAQQRHADVMRQLYAARQVRGAALSELDRQLLERADAVLGAGSPAALEFDAANRYLGYRVLRGNVLLGRIREHLGPATGDDVRPIPDAVREATLTLMRDYVTNTEAYLTEMRGWHDAHPGTHDTFLEGEIDDEDAALAERANLGEAGTWDFATPHHVADGLAEFILLGRPDYYGDIEFTVTPTLAAADPSYRERAYRWLAFALQWAEAHPDPAERAFWAGKTLDLWGDCLLAEGRTAEAIARWQQLLDSYPTHEDYADFEAQILQALSP